MSLPRAFFRLFYVAAISVALPVAAQSGSSGALPIQPEGGRSASPFDPYDYEYCLACHGAVGQGNPVLNAPVLAGMEPWYIRNQLRAFRAGWRGAHEADLVGMEMRAIATALEPRELDAVIEFVAELPPPVPAASQSHDLSAGRSLYAGCAACHGERAEGVTALQAPALWYQQEAYLRRQLQHFRDAVRGSAAGDQSGAAMQAAASGLTDSDIETLLAYIRSRRP